MYLQKTENVLKIWKYAIANGANVVMMRHGPKSGSNESNLSEQGKKITTAYGQILGQLGFDWFNQALIGHTEKMRTRETVELLFPDLDSRNFIRCSKFNSPLMSEELQRVVNRLHFSVGRWRGYSLNETYALLERINGNFTIEMEEDLWRVNASKVAEGIDGLFKLNCPVIFCGHSPNLEIGIIQVLRTDLIELGGFLKPLDSIHLKLGSDGKPVWVARVNPIRDYIDPESEYFLNLPDA